MKSNFTVQSFRSALGLLIVSMVATASSANAQSLDDLFSRPTDAQFQQASTGNMNPESNEAVAAPAQRVDTTGPRSPSDLKLQKAPGSSIQPARSMAMQIRQQRALMESRARLARLEAARWAGNPALRPSWNPDPYTSLRYPNRNLITVPVFVRSR